MPMRLVLPSLVCLLLAASVAAAEKSRPASTVVSIAGEKFLVNGHPTYAGRTWEGVSIEGRLMNSAHDNSRPLHR